MENCISTFIINLEKRPERLKNVLEEFQGKTEFEIIVIKAVEHKVGAYGLFKSIQEAVKIAVENDDDVIIICEDDHVFTEQYSQKYLFDNIKGAFMQDADLLCGGTSGGYSIAVPVSDNRLWVDCYFCNQFLIVFKKFFKTILTHEFDERSKVDHTMSYLAPTKMVLCPFVSEQKFFGYSDVTQYNEDNPEYAINRFRVANMHLSTVQKIRRYYNYQGTPETIEL